METKPENQVWDGEGPQSSSPSVTCEFEHAPERCNFPMCACASVTSAPDRSMLAIDDDWEGNLRMTNGGDPCRASGPVTTAAELEAAMNQEVVVHGFDRGKDDYQGDGALAESLMKRDPSLTCAGAHGLITQARDDGHLEPEPLPEGYEVVMVQQSALDALAAAPNRKPPKRDRAKYMRTYRSQRRAARTQ